MNKLLSVEFTYGHNTYHALVRLKQVDEWKEYFITIMDGHLHEYVGKDIYLMEKEGHLLNSYDKSKEAGKILDAITKAIALRLNEGSVDKQNFNPS
jgi:hypothetical protein